MLYRIAPCALALLVLSACGDDSTISDASVADADASQPDGEAELDAAPDAGVDLPPIALESGDLRFDLAAALDDDFFAFPYPSDLRTHEAGTPDLGSFPSWRGVGNLLSRTVALVEAGAPGFSPLSTTYFVFDRALDPETLPADAAGAAGDAASAFVVDVTPGSPSYGERAFISVVYNDAGGGYWPPHALALRPLYGLPLRPATTYAAVVTTAVAAADATTLAPPTLLAELSAILDGAAVEEGGAELAGSLAPLHDALPDLGLETGDLLAATVFTTSDPMAELRDLRAWMHETLPAPTATDLTLASRRAGYSVYEGTFDAVELFEGEAPYRDFGAGRIALGDDGQPTARTDIDLTFAISVPDGESPAEGWPVLLYGHGLGEDYRGFLRHVAGPMAERGVAVLGISPPLQGERNPTDMSDTDLVTTLAIANILAGREILRQGVLDEVRAAQLVQGGLAIPAEVASGATVISFDPDRVAFMGHSEGAQIGALLLPLEPSLQAGVFSAGGGGAAITMLILELDGLNVGEAVGTIVGIDVSAETFDLDHPVTAAVIQPLLDAADPLHSARSIVREPVEGGPRHLVMSEGFDDHLTPPASTEALASAIGLPIAEPVGRAIDGLELQGVDSVALPVSGNLRSAAGAVATGALLQFSDQGHYLVYFDEPARTQLFDFLAAALSGAPEVPALVVGE